MNQVNIYPSHDAKAIKTLHDLLTAGDPNLELNIQPYDIVVEKVLRASDAAFKFKLGERKNMRPLETALGKNDSFLMTHMALGIYKETPPDTPQNYEYGGNAQPLYFPDANVFTAAATTTAVSEADALEALYKGEITAKADQDEVLLSLQTYRFRKVPYFQTSATTKASYVGQQFQKMYIPILFDGDKTNTFDFSPAESADLVQIAGTSGTNVLQPILRGYIVRDWAQSATIMQLRKRGVLANLMI